MVAFTTKYSLTGMRCQEEYISLNDSKHMIEA